MIVHLNSNNYIISNENIHFQVDILIHLRRHHFSRRQAVALFSSAAHLRKLKQSWLTKTSLRDGLRLVPARVFVAVVTL